MAERGFSGETRMADPQLAEERRELRGRRVYPEV